MTQLRKTLPPLPDSMKRLPIDDRGYPIPWFVHWVDGKPDFRVFDGDKFTTAVRANLCPICGTVLGRYKSFVGGPMTVLQLVSGEPPVHRDCALFAARACPFLALPKAKRRDNGLPDQLRAPGEKQDAFYQGNPGIVAVWTCTRFRVSPTMRTFHYQDMTSLEWFTEGRAATREEIETALIEAKERLTKLAQERT